MNTNNDQTRIAKLSLNLLIAGFLLPIILYALGLIFAPQLQLDNTLFWVGTVAILLSLLCAIISWSVRSSKIIVGGITLLFLLLLIFNLVPA